MYSFTTYGHIFFLAVQQKRGLTSIKEPVEEASKALTGQSPLQSGSAAKRSARSKAATKVATPKVEATKRKVGTQKTEEPASVVQNTATKTVEKKVVTPAKRVTQKGKDSASKTSAARSQSPVKPGSPVKRSTRARAIKKVATPKLQATKEKHENLEPQEPLPKIQKKAAKAPEKKTPTPAKRVSRQVNVTATKTAMSPSPVKPGSPVKRSTRSKAVKKVATPKLATKRKAEDHKPEEPDTKIQKRATSATEKTAPTLPKQAGQTIKVIITPLKSGSPVKRTTRSKAVKKVATPKFKASKQKAGNKKTEEPSAKPQNTDTNEQKAPTPAKRATRQVKVSKKVTPKKNAGQTKTPIKSKIVTPVRRVTRSRR